MIYSRQVRLVRCDCGCGDPPQVSHVFSELIPNAQKSGYACPECHQEFNDNAFYSLGALSGHLLSKHGLEGFDRYKQEIEDMESWFSSDTRLEVYDRHH
jgi:hypothetical protein